MATGHTNGEITNSSQEHNLPAFKRVDQNRRRIADDDLPINSVSGAATFFSRRQKTMRLRLLALLALLLFGGGAAYGQGVILPQECRRCPPIPMPRPVPIPRVLNIKSVTITTKI